MREKKVRDLGYGKRGTTVVLRERTFRIQFEVSRRTLWRLLRDHRGWVIAMCAVIVTIAFAQMFMVGFASTAEFYPSSCLGSWDNVQNALGAPRVPPGSPGSAFTPLNSAVFSTGTAQMFCGNFSGQTDIAALAAKQFQSATLVLSWYVAVPQAAEVGGGDGGAGAAAAGSASGTASSSTETASGVSSSSAALIAPSSTVSPGTTTPTANVPMGVPATNTAVTATTTPATDAQATTTQASTINTTTTSAAAPVSTATTTTPATPAAPPPSAAPASSTSAAPPPAPAPSSASSSATSWLFNFFPVAFAQDASSAATSAPAAIASPAASSVPASAVSVASSAVESIPETSTPAVPISIDTAAFHNVALPPAAPGDFLAIVYSTDGVTWQPLININGSNWAAGRYPIPITSWDELQHLQIAFVGLGAFSSPTIYLDAAGVEVGYADASNGTIAPAPGASSAASSTMAAGTSTVFQQPASSSAPPPVDPLGTVFDPAAGQHCSVTPFSNGTGHPGSVSYVLALSPPSAPPAPAAAPAPSSSPAPSSRATPISVAPPPLSPAVLPGPPLFAVSLGSLPDGVTGQITATGAQGIDTISLGVGPDARPGSYGIIVVYKERQFDGKTLPNFCQFNLVID